MIPIGTKVDAWHLNRETGLKVHYRGTITEVDPPDTTEQGSRTYPIYHVMRDSDGRTFCLSENNVQVVNDIQTCAPYDRDHMAEILQRRDAGLRCEVTEALYFYFLEVLPPVDMHYITTLTSGETRRVEFGFAEGEETVTGFWRAGGRFYCQLTKEMNRG